MVWWMSRATKGKADGHKGLEVSWIMLIRVIMLAE